MPRFVVCPGGPALGQRAGTDVGWAHTGQRRDPPPRPPGGVTRDELQLPLGRRAAPPQHCVDERVMGFRQQRRGGVAVGGDPGLDAVGGRGHDLVGARFQVSAATARL